jgi:nucleolar protein 15
MEQTTGVLYVAHLPWGTNEALIKKYFEQFGTISRFILPRSKHTGRIKGYSFIEYETMEIAKIAANTMNNFILFDRIIKCDVISDRSRYNKIFRRWKRQYKYFNKYNRFVTERNKKKSMKELKENVERYVEKENKKREKLRELGLNYDFPGFKKILESSKLKSKLN